MAAFLASLPAYAQYSGGTGEPNDPYQIATAEDLMLLGESPEDYGKHFILTADIDLDPNLPGRKVFDRAMIAPDTNDVEGGSQGIAFTGILDGNGHTISHLTISGDRYLELFGQLGSGAIISNLALESVNVNGTGDYVGGLVGENEGNITSSYSTGTVSGNMRVGGLVGHNSEGSITSSYSTGSVSGDDHVGGLVGYNNGSITSSLWDIQTSDQVTSDGGTGKTTAEIQDINTYLSAGWDFADEILNGTCDYWLISPGAYPRLRYQDSENLQMPE